MARKDDQILSALHHVQLAMPAGGEDEAREFYWGILGLVEVPKPEALAARGGTWFEKGGVRVHLGIEEPFHPARKAHPAFVVPHLDVLALMLTAAGAPVHWDEDLPGYRRFHTEDPFGNRIEFLAPA